MRFLEDHEIPEPERSRRQKIRAIIEGHKKAIDDEWCAATPELVRMIAEGRYEAERDLRNAIDARTEVIRREMARLAQELPPYLEMRRDEFLERVMIVENK